MLSELIASRLGTTWLVQSTSDERQPVLPLGGMFALRRIDLNALGHWRRRPLRANVVTQCTDGAPGRRVAFYRAAGGDTRGNQSNGFLDIVDDNERTIEPSTLGQ